MREVGGTTLRPQYSQNLTSCIVPKVSHVHARSQRERGRRFPGAPLLERALAEPALAHFDRLLADLFGLAAGFFAPRLVHWRSASHPLQWWLGRPGCRPASTTVELRSCAGLPALRGVQRFLAISNLPARRAVSRDASSSIRSLIASTGRSETRTRRMRTVRVTRPRYDYPVTESVVIRKATKDDAVPIAKIYATFVEHTAVSFEEQAPSPEQMAKRVAHSYSWLLATIGDAVVGYVYAASFHPRAAYRWSCEVSIYMADGARGQGIGRRLLADVLDDVSSRGFVNAFAGSPSESRQHPPLRVIGFRKNRSPAERQIQARQLARRRMVAVSPSRAAHPGPRDPLRVSIRSSTGWDLWRSQSTRMRPQVEHARTVAGVACRTSVRMPPALRAPRNLPHPRCVRPSLR